MTSLLAAFAKRVRLRWAPRASRRSAKVSVIMPVYNGAAYIEEALASAKAQSYRDIEIIVVDDGSTDETANIVARMAQGDPRVHILTKDNGGVASALNRGIKAATGVFICWLSHDDVFRPEKTAVQVERFAALDDPKTILCSNYDLIDANGELLGKPRLDGAMIATKPEYAVLRGCVNGCTIFAPRAMFDEIGLFDESLPSTQDYDLWLRALDSYRFVFMPEVLVSTRQHSEQGSKQADYTTEFNAFWIKAVDRISPKRAAELEGSTVEFYAAMARFLEAADAQEAAAHARRRARRQIASGHDQPLVSVVIPFHSGIDLLRAAIYSVRAQTHRNIEIILVHDTPETDPSPYLPQPAEGEPSVTVYCQDGRGAGMARNYGKKRAKGEYVAFLDADDQYLPTKVERQLALMRSADAAISHTSYFIHGIDLNRPSAFQNSGVVSGTVFPEIISYNPVAMPTVMVRRDIAERFDFPDAPGCEDFLWLLNVVYEHDLHSTMEPLSVVRVSTDSVAYNPQKQSRSLRAIVARLEADPRFDDYRSHIDHLKALASDLEMKLAG
ncbi:glycosyltransferase family 2 protein [Pseudohoeflea coraliihabitans]|uniref:Glycosyltransferase n=1 Tax=Pseudohoeflea coraliihabitans TaxID=2860393 RepID=A0ABS6WQC1_9HYPH|nr:glycosyltransferase [Pseudohoeflea sp. DP4N28-3]MBW3097259.1 glycosyltransferase [Pseudohoeflea sp. DP4N28-3]